MYICKKEFLSTDGNTYKVGHEISDDKFSNYFSVQEQRYFTHVIGAVSEPVVETTEEQVEDAKEEVVTDPTHEEIIDHEAHQSDVHVEVKADKPKAGKAK